MLGTKWKTSSASWGREETERNEPVLTANWISFWFNFFFSFLSFPSLSLLSVSNSYSYSSGTRSVFVLSLSFRTDSSPWHHCLSVCSHTTSCSLFYVDGEELSDWGRVNCWGREERMLVWTAQWGEAKRGSSEKAGKRSEGRRGRMR